MDRTDVPAPGPGLEVPVSAYSLLFLPLPWRGHACVTGGSQEKEDRRVEQSTVTPHKPKLGEPALRLKREFRQWDTEKKLVLADIEENLYAVVCHWDAVAVHYVPILEQQVTSLLTFSNTTWYLWWCQCCQISSKKVTICLFPSLLT